MTPPTDIRELKKAHLAAHPGCEVRNMDPGDFYQCPDQAEFVTDIYERWPEDQRPPESPLFISECLKHWAANEDNHEDGDINAPILRDDWLRDHVCAEDLKEVRERSLSG